MMSYHWELRNTAKDNSDTHTPMVNTADSNAGSDEGEDGGVNLPQSQKNLKANQTAKSLPL